MIVHKVVAICKIIFEYLGLPGHKKNNNKSLSPPHYNSIERKRYPGSRFNLSVKMRLLFQIFNRRAGNLSRVEKRKFFWRKTTQVFATVFFVILIFFALQKPLINTVTSIQLFQIKEISVTGCNMTDQLEIRKLTNLDYSTSIFQVVAEDIVHSVQKHPWIKRAKVKKQWPNGISIDILEYRANAMVVGGPGDEGRFFYLDRKGEIIAPVKAGQNIDYPVITGINDLSGGKKEAAFKDAIAFLKEISRNDPNLPAQSVSEIHLDVEKGMVIHLVEFPFPIYFGRGEVKKKYKQLRKVLAVLYKKRNRNMDISQVEYIRVDYLENKVLIARTESG